MLAITVFAAGTAAIRSLAWCVAPLRLTAVALSSIMFVAGSANAQRFTELPLAAQWYGPQVEAAVPKFVNIAKQLAASSPALAGQMEAAISEIAVVLVPGILGSQLTDESQMIDGRARVIWGPGMGASISQIAARLQLPEALIDQAAQSSIKATLLRNIPLPSPDLALTTFEGYGAAYEKLQKQLSTLPVTLHSCGYDWRRDIRAGARDIENCIRDIEATRSPAPKAFVIIAHSMGGLVTWTWRRLYPAGAVPGRQVLAVVAVGSPLAGSCEMMRMVTSGYQVPESSWVKKPGLWDRLWNWISGTVENGLARVITAEMRPIILSWPGAVELTPPPPNDKNESCFPFEDPAGIARGVSLVWSPYREDFWRGPPGQQILARGGGAFSPPATLKAVLDKATDFHNFFKPTALDEPIVLFRSEYWSTPLRFQVDAQNRLVSHTPGSNDNGDGRVTIVSATGGDSKLHELLSSYVLESVHGDLINEDSFVRRFDQFVLRPIIDARAALAAMRAIANDPALLARYKELGGQLVPWNEVRTGLDPAPAAGQTTIPRPTVSSIVPARETVVAFNMAVQDNVIPSPRALVGLRTDADTSRSPAERQKVAALYELANRVSEPPPPQRVLNDGNAGLMLAKARNFRAALRPLATAVAGFDQLPDSYDPKDRENGIREFKRTVERNYGYALFESGQCEEAKPILEKYNDVALAGDRLRGPCLDLLLSARIPSLDRHTARQGVR